MRKNIPAILIFAVCILFASDAWAQVSPSNQDVFGKAYSKRQALRSSSPVKDLPVRNIGPIVQGGRIVDIEVNPENVYEFYVAYASGGVFKTTNNGQSFESIFDNQRTIGVGDIALAPSNSQIIYVGGGENNSSRSSYAGDGVYRSDDGGLTWQFLGLEGIQHTGRIIVHPGNPDKVWVAAMGNLYSSNEERGVYLTTDGGKTWEKTLYVNDSTGIIDLVINPNNPDQLWASAWERTRKAWNFKGHGPGSSIFRSDDGGKTWKAVNNGFAEPESRGRIGLAVSRENPSVIYALLDNQKEEKKKKERKGDELLASDFIDMGKDDFLALSDEKLNDYLKDNGFPEKYNALSVKNEIRDNKYSPKALSDYLGDANNALFNTSVIGAQVYKSVDSGENWKLVNSYPIDGVYFTYGYYFGEIRLNPKDDDELYIMGVPLLKSNDGGSTWHRLDSIGDVHVDHQSMWINPEHPKHILLGNDGGLYRTYDGGAHWTHINNLPIGQFYTVAVDNQEPYMVYGGLQDNGSLRGSSKSVPNKSKHWDKIFGGDGMYVFPDPENHNLIYTGFQFGNYYRIDMDKNDYTKIGPRHDIGEDPLRFNWRTPLEMSPHNNKILYMGAQKVFRSMNQGNDWTAISDDLTRDLPQGNVPFSTISIIEESPLKFGLIYVGTDDGNIWMTDNGGGNWRKITNGLPEGLWVSSIHPSNHDEGEVFITMTGYREDNFETHVYKSEDFGQSWTSIRDGIEYEAANIIVQDLVQPELLFLGTDAGSYVSFDGGINWEIMASIPNVASYDMVFHPREGELVIATHGRSIYVADIKPLRKIVADPAKTLIAYEVESVMHSDKWGESTYKWQQPYTPKVKLSWYSRGVGELKILIKDESGNEISSWKENVDAGYGATTYDIKGYSFDGKKKSKEKSYLKPGKYSVTYSLGKSTATSEFEVKTRKK
ncbi:WD40/YVTN/BNR-like repeat-containing protein [Marinigracilibium pacificum]|uniref:Glycosyl hydrolase n=1 Tax=Marinigracilibium pacificum TaxID=2729599 RepID=A0A848J4S8_9BACT|nr:glycosyl hydrolase [Marinigracilibium pacificum]NMM49359.1 glycosyl hydrolase [Marinigracilibium pacificum]